MANRLLCLPKLRECLIDARAFCYAGADSVPTQARSIYESIKRAVELAEELEKTFAPDTFKTCINCSRQFQQSVGLIDSKHYCSFGCAEEDGAVEK